MLERILGTRLVLVLYPLFCKYLQTNICRALYRPVNEANIYVIRVVFIYSIDIKYLYPWNTTKMVYNEDGGWGTIIFFTDKGQFIKWQWGPVAYSKFRGSHQKCSVKKVFLEISQNSQENTCARVSFLIKLQAWDCNFIKKETLVKVFCEISKNTFLRRKLLVGASVNYRKRG